MANALGVNYDVSGIAKLDTGTAEGKAIKELSDSYMMLLKRLRYMSTNLGVENFNEVELDKIKSDLIVSLQDDIQGISTEFSVTSGQILAKVEGALGDYVSTTQLEMTLNGLSLAAESSGGSAKLVIQSEGQTIGSGAALTLSASNNANGYSTLSLKSGGVTLASSGNITLGGNVVFASGSGTTKDLSRTVISGGTISSETITALNITANTVKANASISSPVITGGSIYGCKLYAVAGNTSDYLEVHANGFEMVTDGYARAVLEESSDNVTLWLGNNNRVCVQKYYTGSGNNITHYMWIGSSDRQSCGIRFNISASTYKIFGTAE